MSYDLYQGAIDDIFLPMITCLAFTRKPIAVVTNNFMQ